LALFSFKNEINIKSTILFIIIIIKQRYENLYRKMEDKWYDTLRSGKCLDERNLKMLCEKV
jgi:hypothetical protein